MTTEDLSGLFANGDRGAQQMHALLIDPKVWQITCDRHDRISVVGADGTTRLDRIFGSAQMYVGWINELMRLTDVGYTDVTTAKTSVIEGSFRPDKIPVHGSIHICTWEITRGEPAVTVRKQPNELITLDDMFRQGMMNADMRLFLEQAVRGRSNILLSGGSGSGKTTLARALSYFVDPAHRVVTVEEIDELHLYDRLPNVAALTTFRSRDDEGRMLREVDLNDLVRESLRMRADRVWVGETRGNEAYALVKACNSGHDGSVTTLHADSGKQAIRQLVTYVMMAGLSEVPAREQVAQAFDLVVQISKVRMGQRVITEITELEKVLEGPQQRLNTLYKYDLDRQVWSQDARPTHNLIRSWAKYGVNYESPGRR